VFALALLRRDFADGGGRSREMAVLDSRTIPIEVHDPKGLEQVLQLQKDLIGPAPEHIGQNDPSEMINRLP
jgi:hypothetical protein